TGCRLMEALRQFQGIQCVECREDFCGPRCLVRLQMADQVDLSRVSGCELLGRNIDTHGWKNSCFLLEFLYPVFAKKPQPGGIGFCDLLRRMGFGDRHQLYLISRTPRALTCLGEGVFYPMNIFYKG